ncbi:hypothetical protein [Stigmatella hybrida]|uniref:hypothetical protein n=1 Tax=Stigmatella hybrida TaxID=394097 RepID=UPI001CDAE636|nr:hypothetical protein [Stigmatella hybrida]
MATRLIVVVLLGALLHACATQPRVRLDTGHGAPREYSPSSSARAVRVDEEAFEKSLAQLVLSTPLTLRPPEEGWLVRASSPGRREDPRWQRLMRKTLRDDVMGLSEWDKLGIGLGLSLHPLKESIAKAVEDTLAPQLFLTIIAAGLITWAVLAANPEPVFTKAAAIVSALLLIYLGVETFLEMVAASRELKQATDRATTWEELEHASHRFANRIGPKVARIFVLAVTVAVGHGVTGGAAWLSSRLSVLPSFPEAAAVGVSRLGFHLENVGQISSVAVTGRTIVISLPATAVSMAARSTSGGGSAAGAAPAFRSWGSFSGLKSALGPAGAGKQWHHIVEQTPGNVRRFGARALHNTENVIPLEEALHLRLSAFYSRKAAGVTGSTELTVRQWLSTQSHEAQRKFGLMAMENMKKGVW